jgi:hypothetical protein
VIVGAGAIVGVPGLGDFGICGRGRGFKGKEVGEWGRRVRRGGLQQVRWFSELAASLDSECIIKRQRPSGQKM